MLKIYDQNKNPAGYISKYKDVCIESDLSTGDKALSFTYCARKAKNIQNEYYVETKDDRYVVKETGISSDGFPEYQCKLDLEDLESYMHGNFVSQGNSLLDAARLAVAGTGWRVQSDIAADKVRSVGVLKATPYTVLGKIRDAWMCEMQFDTKNKIVCFSERFGEDRGVYFVSGLNLNRLKYTEDTYDFYTRIIPIGKDGLKITDANDGKEYVENYQYSSKIRTLIWEDSSYEDASALKEDSIAKLEDLSKPKKSYSVGVFDLAKQSQKYSLLEYGLGDTTLLLDEKTGIREKQRIVKMKEYPQTPEKNTCELSNTVLSWEEYQSKLEAAAAAFENVTNADGTINGVHVKGIGADGIAGLEITINNSSTVKDMQSQLVTVKGDVSSLGDSVSTIDGEVSLVKARIGTVEATYIKATEADIRYATLEKANILDAKIQSIDGDYAKFKSTVTDELSAHTAKIDNLDSDYANFKDATISDLSALNASIDTINASNITVDNLKAKVAELGYLSAEQASLKYAQIDFANVKEQVVGTALIKDASITDAKILSLSANKLTAGIIDAAKITVTNLNADNITVGRLNGKLIGNGTIDLDRLSEEVPTKDDLNAVQNGLQDQIDKSIQTYTVNTIPLLNNEPAQDWAASDYPKHVGDICYVINPGGQADGYTYRFEKDGSTYSWSLIKDSQVTEALQKLLNVDGDLSGLKSFQSETSSWITKTDSELSSVKSRTTTIETTYSTKAEAKNLAEDAKTGAIDEAAKDATSKANQAKSDAISEAASDATSKANSALDNAKKYADDAVDGVEVGGRNLWIETGYTSDSYTSGSTTKRGWYKTPENILFKDDTGDLAEKLELQSWTCGQYVYVKKDQAYTFSCDVKLDSSASVESSNFRLYTDVLNIKNYVFPEKISKEWKRITITYISPVSGIERFHLRDITGNSNHFWIKHIKMEIGTKATDWTPAPEDIEQVISTKVESTVFNEVKQTVDTNSAQITQMTKTLEQKADGSTVESLQQTVNSVQQTANENMSKISQVTQSVEKAQSTADDANSKIDGLEIGGRNLLHKTSFEQVIVGSAFTADGVTHNTYAEGWGGYNGGITNPTTSYHAYLDPTTHHYVFDETDGSSNWKGLSVGNYNSGLLVTNLSDSYIFSATVKATGLGTKLHGGFYYTKKGTSSNAFHSGQFSITDIPDGKEVRLSAKVPLNDDVDFTAPVYFYIYGYNFVGKSKLEMWKPKLEKGTKATDWTPAPEDMATQNSVEKVSSTVNEVKQTADGNSAKITQMNEQISQKADGSKVTQLEKRTSSVEQNLSGFKSEVSSTYTTKTEAKKYADDAKTDAVSEAAKDATSKANQAEQNAKVDQYIKDTRQSNYSPSYYMGIGVARSYEEFKLCSVIGLPSTTESYCVLTTHVPWPDKSGGYPKQIAKVSNGTGMVECWRVGFSDDTWSDWYDSRGAITELATSYSSYVEQTDSKIAAKLESSTFTTFENGYKDFKKSTNEFIGTSEKWEMKWDKIFNSGSANEDTYNSYITFQNGEIYLGNSKSLTKLNLKNDIIEFTNNNVSVASFGQNSIYLGKNSKSSIIDLCNGTATISNLNPDQGNKRLLISGTDSVDIKTGYTLELIAGSDASHNAQISMGSYKTPWDSSGDANGSVEISATGNNYEGGISVGAGRVFLTVKNPDGEWGSYIDMINGAINFAGNASFYGSVTVPTIYASNWFRSSGQTGWYSETYGGGIYMTDTDWVRVYNNKAFRAEGAISCGFEFISHRGARDWRFGSATGTGDQNQFGFYDTTYGYHGSIVGSDHTWRSVGGFITTAPDAFRAAYGSYGFFIRQDNADTYFMLTNAGDPYGLWNSYRPLRIHNADGTVYMETTKYFYGLTYIYNSNGIARLWFNANGNFITTNANGDNNSYHANLGSSANYWGTLNYSALNKVSDKRYKNDLGNLTEKECTDILENISIKKFTMKDENKDQVQYGVYAQDVRDLLINTGLGYRSMLRIAALDDSNDNITDLMASETSVRYGIDYVQFIPLLIKGWQKQNETIKYLESRLENALAQIQAMQQTINRLEMAI